MFGSHSYHAPGVGIIQVSARGGDEQETLIATEHRTLTPEELAAANARALELDQRAYTLAPAVWAQTERAALRCALPVPPTATPSSSTTTTTAAAPPLCPPPPAPVAP